MQGGEIEVNLGSFRSPSFLGSFKLGKERGLPLLDPSFVKIVGLRAVI